MLGKKINKKDPPHLEKPRASPEGAEPLVRAASKCHPGDVATRHPSAREAGQQTSRSQACAEPPRRSSGGPTGPQERPANHEAVKQGPADALRPADLPRFAARPSLRRATATVVPPDVPRREPARVSRAPREESLACGLCGSLGRSARRMTSAETRGERPAVCGPLGSPTTPGQCLTCRESSDRRRRGRDGT